SFCSFFFFFSSRRRHTRSKRDWSSDVCSSDLGIEHVIRGDARCVVTVPVEPRQPLPQCCDEVLPCLRRFSLVTPVRQSPGAERQIGRASCRERVWVAAEEGA